MVARIYALFGRPNCESHSGIALRVEQERFCYRNSSRRAHQHGQMEMTQHGVKHKPCHRWEILITNLTLLHKVNSLHWSVPDLLAIMDMFKSVRADLPAVQADEIQSLPGIHVLFNFGQVTPHPRRNQNMKPRLANLKPVIQCFYLWKC